MAVDPFLRRQIIAAVESTLREADVVDVLPTPLERVARVAGVKEILNVSDIPDDLVSTKPSALRRILGAYLYRSDTAFVDLTQPVGRSRFILAHEAGHKIVPWHHASHHLDDETRLFRDSEEELENEANLAGTLLMFQGARFHRRALDYETGLDTPIALAATYGASLHASIWFYVEHHPEPIALVIAGQYPRADGTVPIWRSIQSRAFVERFGALRGFFPAGGVPVQENAQHPFTGIASGAFSGTDVATHSVNLTDVDGDAVSCAVQTFFNQRCLFLMVSPKRAIRRGRRIVVRAG